MECTSEKCKGKLGKRLRIVHDSFNDSSESSLSSDSDTQFGPFNSLSRKRRKAPCGSRRDYLSRLFERKKLKDKSLSKKLRTPFDRKIHKTCWPIELKKVTKIKKKPHEKRREKPTHRSLTPRHLPELYISCYRGNSPQIIYNESDATDNDSFRMKFSNPRFFREYTGSSPKITCSELEFLNDDSFVTVYHHLRKKQFLYDEVTPELLLEVLQDPEYLKTGATIDMIAEKIRDLNMDFNPELDQLKEEISVKLLWAVKLGIITEIGGYYRIAENFLREKSPKKTVSLIWDWWYCRMKKITK